VRKFRKVGHFRLNPFIGGDRINMKGKFRIWGHIGLALFLVCALMLTVVPATKVEAATPVTNVWVQFLTTTYNLTNTDADFTIHFTPTTALSRGVDTITVWFPDGSTAMGPAAFSLASAVTTAAYYEVDANGEATGAAVECTSAAVLSQSGYRITVTTPVDLAAGTACSLLIQDEAIVACANDASHSPYYIKVYTSQDTTPVASDAFDIDATGANALAVALTPATAGSAGQYTFTLDLTSTAAVVPVGGTASFIFPYGTTIPSSISAENVKVSNDSGSVYESCTTAPTINQKARMITLTTPVQLDQDATNRVRFITAANIQNPTTATDYAHYYACTSLDELLVKATSAVTITAGTATKIGFNNDSIPDSYSDSSTMINMYSSILYVQSQDAYGNLKHVTTGAEPTVSFASSNASTGIFYDGVGSQISSKLLVDGLASIYYRDTTAGTVTITASATSYDSGTWTITIAAGVELYDSSDNLIKTFAPTWASATAESTTVHSGDYIQNAINAAVEGDTVKLGGTADAPAINELDAYINLNKKITMTSATGASYTTIRPVSEALNSPYNAATDLALLVGVTGTAANPVIIDGLTFDRLRSAVEFDQAILNNAYNYVTVQNCTFNYIIPDYDCADSEYGNVVSFITHHGLGGGQAAITSGTISNNTFTNCCSFAADPDGEHAVINIMAKDWSANTKSITGITVSGNTLTNCNGLGISFNGYAGTSESTYHYVTGNITDNTLTNPVQGLSIQRQTRSVNVLRNTVTGAYTAGLFVEGDDHDNLVIKNNTFTGCAGADKLWFASAYSCESSAILIFADGSAAAGNSTDTGANTVQYNAIYDNDATYSIYSSDTDTQDCKYNYYGDGTGPYYSALAGATIDKSNTGGAGKKVSDDVTYYPWLHKSLTDVVADNVSYQACTMKLASGWNTLSTPVQLIAAANSVDELIPAHMTIGYYYDAGWQQITTGKVLSPCDAVYVKMSIATDVLLKFDASAWTMPSKDLAVGWNLTSLAYLSSKDAGDAVASVANTAANLPGYSQVISPSLNATQTGMLGTAGLSWAESTGQTASNVMLPGLGYWVYMQNASTLAGFEITPIAPDLD